MSKRQQTPTMFKRGDIYTDTEESGKSLGPRYKRDEEGDGRQANTNDKESRQRRRRRYEKDKEHEEDANDDDEEGRPYLFDPHPQGNNSVTLNPNVLSSVVYWSWSDLLYYLAA